MQFSELYVNLKKFEVIDTRGFKKDNALRNRRLSASSSARVD